MMRLFACLFLLLFLSRCQDSDPEIIQLADERLPISQRISLAFGEDYMSTLGIPEELQQELKDFYNARNCQPLWTNDSLLNAGGEKFRELARFPLALGIPDARWKKLHADTLLVAQELLLTAKFGSLWHDLKAGYLDTAAKCMKPLKLADAGQLLAMRAQLDTVSDIGGWLAGNGPNLQNYRQLAKAIYLAASGKKFSEKSFDLPEMKKDSAGCYEMAKSALLEKGYLARGASDSAFFPALYRFQEDRGLKADKIIGKYTRKALNESSEREMERAVLSLERWRWRSPFTERYIWINIPEYRLRIYYNDTLFSEHNVVVGKFDTKTPQLRSRVRDIVAYPYWVVPFSITSKEFLPALKANSGYLEKNHLRIYKSGEVEVDPSTVNWKNIRSKSFPYRVVQDPGKWNSLGIIKFEFTNSYGVYLHDTPQKNYFSKDVRSYSHGCIRCQHPDSLARFIIRRDRQKYFTADSLDSVLVRQKHRVIPLKHPIDIQIDYITGIVNAKGELQVLLDVYDRDAEYLKWYEKGAES